MAIGVSEFVDRFPAFRNTDRRLVEAKLTEARAQVSSSIWGDLYDQGVGYLAAHLLAASGHGEHARLIPANAKAQRSDALTTYEREYKRLLMMVSHGFRVVGSASVTEA